MKFFNFYQQGELRLGALQSDIAVDLTAGGIGKSTDQLISQGKKSLEQAQVIFPTLPALDSENLIFAPPVLYPEKILCIGLNYSEHRAETNFSSADVPTVFSKFKNTLAAHEQAILLPSVATQYDYEAELVIVIGKKAHNLKPSQALTAVFGYTIGNDLSARDLQLRTSQWLLGKTLDKFAPLGPFLVPADKIDPSNLRIQSYVNGQLRQDANTRQMIFDCAFIVSYLSQYMTLQPGDLIFTGTPSGVILGYPPEKQRWLKTGDEIRIRIEHLGELTNTLI